MYGNVSNAIFYSPIAKCESTPHLETWYKSKQHMTCTGWASLVGCIFSIYLNPTKNGKNKASIVGVSGDGTGNGKLNQWPLSCRGFSGLHIVTSQFSPQKKANEKKRPVNHHSWYGIMAVHTTSRDRQSSAKNTYTKQIAGILHVNGFRLRPILMGIDKLFYFLLFFYKNPSEKYPIWK